MGRCVVTLAAQQRTPVGLAIDSSHAYWTTETGLFAVPIGGGSVATLASGAGGALDPNVLAIDSTNAYWGSGAGLQRTPLDGGSSMMLVASVYPEGVAVNGANVYWTGDNALKQVPLAGGTPITLAAMQPNPDGVTLDTQRVYWGTNGDDLQGGGGVLAVPLDGGAPITLASDFGGPSTVAVGGGNIYLSDSMDVYPGGVNSAPLDSDGGETPMSIVSPPSASAVIASFAIDGNTVYYSSNDGTVHKAPLDGSGQPTLLVSGLMTPQAVRVDSNSVYFTDNSAGTVTKVTPK